MRGARQSFIDDAVTRRLATTRVSRRARKIPGHEPGIFHLFASDATWG